MKIAIDIREAVKSKRAGKGWYAFEIIKGLLQLHENDPSIQFLLYTDQPYPEFEHYSNVTQRFFPPSTFRWHFQVLSDLKKTRPDIYFAPTSYIVPALAPAWLKVVITVHDLVAWLFPVRHHLKATLIERLTLPRAAKHTTNFITVSENTKRDLQKFFHVTSKDITVIPCGVNETFRPFSPQEKADFHTSHPEIPMRFLLAVGTLEPRKNYEMLIRSFAQLTEKYPDLHLIIVGGKGWYYEKIFEEVRTLSLETKVHFAGYISEEDLPGYYNLAQAFVFPSLYEGFGIPPLEAMKSGCPVVCSNTSSLPEVVADAALLIDPASESSLVQAMDTLLSSPSLSQEFSQKGLAQSAKFSWVVSAHATSDLLMKLARTQ